MEDGAVGSRGYFEKSAGRENRFAGRTSFPVPWKVFFSTIISALLFRRRSSFTSEKRSMSVHSSAEWAMERRYKQEEREMEEENNETFPLKLIQSEYAWTIQVYF